MSNDFYQMKKDCLGPEYKTMDSYNMRGPTKVCMPYKKGGSVKRSSHFIGGNVAPNNIDPTNTPPAMVGTQPTMQSQQMQQVPQNPSPYTGVNPTAVNPNMPLKSGGIARDKRAIGGVGKVRKNQY